MKGMEQASSRSAALSLLHGCSKQEKVREGIRRPQWNHSLERRPGERCQKPKNLYKCPERKTDFSPLIKCLRMTLPYILLKESVCLTQKLLIPDR